ncbi:hypothetical protein PENDEC_c021G01093 [Penicillium decumbens]|uniref:Gag1-like clamp domain-containing protein n=1 Tax=Penicillium decumbens TaxID=69771 RepID=A0A1V6P654_PENDC|nr:hypothetical protein PENDEC_c021G01093 [Penicillium decumbens]
MSGDSRDTAIREAKRFVREVVRNDWEFDPSTSSEAAQPSSTVSTGTLYQNRQVTEWRCREYDSSGSELEPQSSDDDESESPSGRKVAALTEIERRRRRHRQMDEEMAWNEGLRMWMARRDAWSGARTRRQIRAGQRKRNLEDSQSLNQDQFTVDGSDSGVDTGEGKSLPSRKKAHGEGSGLASTTEKSLPISEKERTEESQNRQEQEEEQSTAPDDEQCKESTETSITEPNAQTSEDSDLVTFPALDDNDLDEDEEELYEPLIPVAPPFISSENPIRATIGPAIYPSIYTKVVVQGMTPTIPVNLADLTKAMVQGWKTDGQWPPKPAVTSIVLQDDASVPKTVPSDAPTQTQRKNSITNAMRKVFQNPFHRRGSTDAATGTGAPSTA